MIAENPAQGCPRTVAGPAARKSFTTDEVQRLLDGADNRENTSCYNAAHHGHAALRAPWARSTRSISTPGRCVRRAVLEVDHAPVLREITKSESSARTISIPPPLVELLRDQRAQCSKPP